MMEGILAVVAQFDNDVRAQRTVTGMRAAAEKGRWNHVPPIGYCKPVDRSGSSIVHDSERAPLVRRAFEDFATGRFSQASLLRRLNALGLTTRGGSPVSRQTLKRMLRNPIYKGRIVEPKLDVNAPGDFDPIVQEELWDRVQTQLSRKGHKPSSKALDHPDFPLRRYVRCAIHDGPSTGSFSKGRSASYPYYRCRKSGCWSASKADLERQFVELLEEVKPQPQYAALFREVMLDVWRNRRAEADAHVEALRKRLSTLEGRQSKLVDALLNRVISEAAYKQKEAELTLQIGEAKLELYEADRQQVDVDSLLGFAERLLAHPAALWLDLKPEARLHFQHLVFPKGITYDGRRFGTDATAVVFSLLGGSEVEKGKVVTPTGFEPVLPG